MPSPSPLFTVDFGDDGAHDSPKVDFGKLLTNCPAIRAFSIANHTSASITLQFLTSSAADLHIYQPRPVIPAATVTDGPARPDDECANLQSLVSYEHLDTYAWFPDMDEQRESVEKEIERIQYFKRCVGEALIVPTDRVEIETGQTVALLLVYCIRTDLHPSIRGKLKNMPAKLIIRPDHQLGSDILVQIHAMVCHASMHFALKHINFGPISKILLPDSNPRHLIPVQGFSRIWLDISSVWLSAT
jgi:hypothetical protein